MENEALKDILAELKDFKESAARELKEIKKSIKNMETSIENMEADVSEIKIILKIE
ncbi:hypothetical protein [Desulfitobacterium sp. PCE1]|uniref:hypothetical protein n=1 Tax=Desulfitobacterium sp. PCE1 TaxID=146907 RepID=UPI00036B34B3|nr:hypothetical protein [Desulfitobacterium sp. PCE1]